VPIERDAGVAADRNMTRSNQQLREDALAIWRAGVDAVRSDRAVESFVRVDGRWLVLGDVRFDLNEISRIAVVGAGKAGAGMAAGLENALGHDLLAEKEVRGWVNVPADCVRELSRIQLHAARPAGVNEPTEAGVAGAAKILEIVDSLRNNDLCVCLISGGGSALLPAPAAGVSLADKQAVARHLSGAGANIEQLNIVRKQLSRIKGGGLARACRAGALVSLIISDVLGDPLDVIASGPTVKNTTTAADALEVLEKYGAREAGISDAVFACLEKKKYKLEAQASGLGETEVTNIILGNNATAVDAAGMEAERRGYSHAMSAARESEGPAEEIGRHLADMALRMRDTPGPDCLITGGEPTVELADSSIRGLGGRNQQLVLAAIERCFERSNQPVGPLLDGIVLLSGGTDGEDGPTDAAGALVAPDMFAAIKDQGIDIADFLARNDAYHFFEPLGGLIKTGPTHTNVCDLRVVVVDRINAQPRVGERIA
jgi:glycerate 2-kinase